MPISKCCTSLVSKGLALQDAVILAQSLRDASRKEGAKFANLSSQSIQDALRAYEQKRSLRVTKISVRSNLMGRILGESIRSTLKPVP